MENLKRAKATPLHLTSRCLTATKPSTRGIISRPQLPYYKTRTTLALSIRRYRCNATMGKCLTMTVWEHRC